MPWVPDKPEQYIYPKVIADATGLPTHTIRYYAEIGLIKPAGKTERGHRYYSPNAIEIVKLIRLMQEKDGLSLAEIKEVLDGRNQG